MFSCIFLNVIYIFSNIAAQSVFVLHELCKKTKAPKTNCLRQSYFLTGEIFYVYSNLFSASTYKYNLAQLRKFFIDLHIFDVFVFLCSTDRKRFHIVLIFVPPGKFLYHIVRNQYIYSQIDEHIENRVHCWKYTFLIYIVILDDMKEIKINTPELNGHLPYGNHTIPYKWAFFDKIDG